MTRNKPLASVFLILLLLLPLNPATAQKRPARPRPTPKPIVSQPVSFDNLLSADTYKIYVEVRNVGQLISSGSVNELLEPVVKLAAPPKEFKTAVKWLTTHAQDVMTSRLLVAAWPTAKNVPDVLIAVEFDNPEDAAKFDPQVKAFLPKILPPSVASPSPSATTTPASKDEPAAASASPNTTTPASKDQTAAPSATSSEPQPTFFVKRAGNLVFITNTALTLKNLRPANSKPLAEDSNFRTIHDRFATEPIFAFLNVKALEKEEEERRQQTIEKREAAKPEVIAEAESPVEQKKDSPDSEEDTVTSVPDPKVTVGTLGSDPAEQTTPDPVTMALTQLAGSFFGGGGFEQKWPEAIGFGLSLDSASLDIRALLVNSPSEKSVAIPFLPALVSGPTIVPESPSVLPADTELFVVMSLDVPQIYYALSHPPTPKATTPPEMQPAGESQPESPFAIFEKRLGIKLETDLLPLIGNEIVFSMPVDILYGGPQAPPPTSDNAAGETRFIQTPSGPSPIIAVSLRDKDAMRILLPKMIDSFAFKGASGFAKTEKREDTEIVSYANILAYAFIGNFLVLSPDLNAVRHVVDSYLKHETLSSDVNFRNFTRWQPRQLQGQVYVSPALMEIFKTWAREPSALLSDQARELLIRLSTAAEPITYSLTNEGVGPLHQVRIPKNLVLMAVTGISGETNPPPMVANERATLGALYTIAHAESTIQVEKGAYVTLDELVAQGKINRQLLEGYGYRISVSVSGNGFEAVAVPVEYGKTGKMSYFVNEDRVIRGADNGGAPASAADKPIN